MSRLYIIQAQPNPPGRDTTVRGRATNGQLNEEWLEFEAVDGDRNLVGDSLSHVTFSGSCAVTGSDVLIVFNDRTLRQGQCVRLHTGVGVNAWQGTTLHMYLGRSWFVWNNACGDRATISYQNNVIDSARYAPNPPEGILVRVPGTDRLEPARAATYR